MLVSVVCHGVVASTAKATFAEVASGANDRVSTLAYTSGHTRAGATFTTAGCRGVIGKMFKLPGVDFAGARCAPDVEPRGQRYLMSITVRKARRDGSPAEAANAADAGLPGTELKPSESDSRLSRRRSRMALLSGDRLGVNAILT